MPMLAPVARSGSLRTIVCNGSPSHAWRTIADSVLPSRASTFSVWANSGSITSRRLSDGCLGVLVVERVTDLGDQPLAGGQASDQAARERRVGVGEQPADVAPGAALATGRCRADQHDELVGVVAVGLDLVVRAAAARAPERDQEL